MFWFKTDMLLKTIICFQEISNFAYEHFIDMENGQKALDNLRQSFGLLS